MFVNLKILNYVKFQKGQTVFNKGIYTEFLENAFSQNDLSQNLTSLSAI